MKLPVDEASVVFAVAHSSANRICRRTIRSLQSLSAALSGENSGLETVWDEICVQRQDDESLFWETYVETVCTIIEGHLSEIRDHERAAIWLQTEPGIDWLLSEPEKRSKTPEIVEDVVHFVFSDYVLTAAEAWSNKSIRAYLDRISAED